MTVSHRHLPGDVQQGRQRVAGHPDPADEPGFLQGTERRNRLAGNLVQ